MTRPQSKDKNKMVSRGPVTCHQGKAPGAADASSSISKFRVQPREDRPISDFKTVNTIRAEPTFTQSNYPILQVHNPHDQRINGHRSNASGKNADQFIDQLVQKPGMDEEESPLQLKTRERISSLSQKRKILVNP
ncbi:hypothetical protein OIU76_015659 [Salix suchowensis]|nr:hypothetical protein OIU76_015659 [Salix suchowensis]